MDLIEKLLSNDILDMCFDACKRANPYRSNHDKRHAKSCVELSKKLFEVFEVDERKQIIIQTSLIFHDIGQLTGRKGHEGRSADFAIEFLKPLNVFSKDELKEIYSAISTHDEYRVNKFKKLKFDSSWFVNLIDKLDLARNRQVEDADERFGHTAFADIDHLEFKNKDGVFTIEIVTIKKPKVIHPIEIFNINVFSKAMQVTKFFCKHFGLTPRVLLFGQELNLNNINQNVMSR